MESIRFVCGDETDQTRPLVFILKDEMEAISGTRWISNFRTSAAGTLERVTGLLLRDFVF